MTTKKSTKRALLMSALSILLCVSMLIGTTYAWFTDSVTSSGNIIKSGTLDVTMEWKDATATGKQKTYKDASEGAIFNYDKWEPGYVEAKNVKITNAGTLALKYKLNILPTGTVSELANVIDVYFAEGEYTLTNRAMTELKKIGTLSEVLAGMPANMSGDLEATKSDIVTIALKMQESAGNEYQNKEIGSKFAIQLLATQLTAESDSFDDQYDKFADYDGEIGTAASLTAAFANGGTYKVLNDIAVEGESFKVTAGKEVALDLGGNSITGKNASADGAVIENNGTLTLVNGTVSSETVNGAEAIVNNGTMVLKDVTVNGAPMATTGYPAYAVGTSGKLTIEEGTKVYADRGALRTSDGAELIINGGEFIVSNAADGRNMMNHVVYAYGANTTVTINDGYFEYNHTSTGGASVVCPYYATIIVNGGDFRDVMDDSNWTSVGNFQNYMGTKAPVVYGGTYDDKTHTKWLAPGYVSADNGDGTYTVVEGVAVKDAAGLQAAIDAASTTEETIINLVGGTYSENLDLTAAALGTSKGDLVFKAVNGADVVLSGTVTLGYRKQGTGAAMMHADVTFDGITFDHANVAAHSLDVQDVNSLTLKNCTIIGDGEYGITSANGNATGKSTIVDCTFINAGIQIKGNFGTGLLIDNCTFTNSRVNVQGGNGVTVQNCKFSDTLTDANNNESFYLIRSNSTPITVSGCKFTVDSTLNGVGVPGSKGWGIFVNRGTTNWTVDNIEVVMTEKALSQEALKIATCTSTGKINMSNVTLNGVAQ